MSADADLLRTFLAIYRSGSVTKAGHALRLTQPAVSVQLRRLERELGTKLFDRRSRGMTPTDAGHELARRSAPPLAALDAIFAVSPPVPDLVGTVRLGGPADFLAERVLPALVPLLAQRLRVQVSTGLAADLLTALEDGAVDVVVSAVRPTGRAFEYEALYEEEFVLVAAPRWATRGNRTRDAAELADIPLLAYGPDLPIIRRYWRSVFRARLGRVAALVVPDLRALRDAAVAGAGMTVLPAYLVQSELAAGQLVELGRPSPRPSNTLYLCWHQSASPDARRDGIRGTLARAASSW